MAYKFKCAKCGDELRVEWLKPEETARCRGCGGNVRVPADAQETDDGLAPLPEPARKDARADTRPANCPACRYFEKMSAAEQDKAFPGGVSGLCHRYPPGPDGRYPLVTAVDWCGEYDRKK